MFPGKHGLGRKGAGHGFVGESGKNDYNWLKTPPGTPLFPSLEMELERKGQQLVIQREIPIIQPLSRFAGHSESNKKTSSTPPNRNNKTSTPTGTPNLASSLNKKKEATMAQKTCTEPKKVTEFPTFKDRKQRSMASRKAKYQDATQPTNNAGIRGFRPHRNRR